MEEQKPITNADFYRSNLANGNSPKTVGWDNLSTAKLRYETIANMIPKKCKELADVGCGIGLFLEYIPEHIKAYTGYDLMPEYIKQAQKESAGSEAKFVVGGVDHVQEAECIIAIGTFTLRYDWKDDGKYQKYFEECLVKLLQKAKTCLIINAFSSSVDFRDPKLYYHDVNSLFRVAKEQGFMITVNNFHSPYEFNAKFTRLVNNSN